ncbi:MAG: hypothetical protein HY062_11570 [Bacteroidetes bacterium]|nr:hypothetical protein [Bacteroidota bacterium]
MKKLHIPILCFWSVLINLGVLLLVLTCCTEKNTTTEVHKTENQYDSIADYLKRQHQYALSDSIKTIFILTDIGCMPCNKHFSELMSDNLSNSSSLFLILASGVNLDLSSFNSSKSKVFYDRPENITNIFLKQSKAIFIKHHQVDTSIIIEARQIDWQLKTITNRIK